jgi:hypothetical protein
MKSLDTKRLAHQLSLAFKGLSVLAYLTHLLPGEKAAACFAIASFGKEFIILAGDYLDNGQADRSFTPEA